MREVVTEHGGGFRDFAESSRTCVLRAAYYLGASFVSTYPVLRWELGAPTRPEVRQPVVTGFAYGRGPARCWARPRRCWPGGDAAAAVARWRDAVAG